MIKDGGTISKNIIQYNVLISCPDDVHEKIEVIEKAVKKFNEQFSDILGISIRTKHWLKDSYPQSGGKPQELLNKRFKECDACIAIFGTKFGTPTDKYGSGTEEEVENMLSSGKQVFMYFSEEDIPHSKRNSTEFEKIDAFKEKYRNRGLYSTFKSTSELEEKVYAHITKYFLTKENVDKIRLERHSELKLVGISSDEKLMPDATLQKFKPVVANTTQDYIGIIKDLFSEISNIQVRKRVKICNKSVIDILTSDTPLPPLGTPIDITNSQKNFIISMANSLNVNLPNNFFDLGNLIRAPIYYEIKGTDEEKKKFELLNKLEETIKKCLNWAQIEEKFKNFTCLKFALQNDGTAIDEDVEISIIFPKSGLMIMPDEFPDITNNLMDYLLNDCEMSTIFGIKTTSSYLDYSHSKRDPFIKPISAFPVLPGSTPDYNDDFLAELKNIFCYSIFQDSENYILKLKVNYIKHHTVVAFPSVIFIKECSDELTYSITSKNSLDIITNKIKIYFDE